MSVSRLIFGLALSTALVVWAVRPARGPRIDSHKPEVTPVDSRAGITVSRAAPLWSPPALATRDTLWTRFRERFGQELEPRFSPEGRLVAVRGRFGHGKTNPGFSPEDPRKALARAKEILGAASELIGVTPAWPLEQPIAKGGKVSAQIYFKEMSSGVPLAPFGNVWIDLDSQGGLLGLDSSYIPAPTVVNTVDLGASDAMQRAVASVSDGTSAIKVAGGDPILWVERDPRGGLEARHAYEYYVQGRQVIVDASNGAILHKRDVRQY